MIPAGWLSFHPGLFLHLGCSSSGEGKRQAQASKQSINVKIHKGERKGGNRETCVLSSWRATLFSNQGAEVVRMLRAKANLQILLFLFGLLS